MNLLDPDLLRTFIAFVDTGSLARAAAIAGRTPSAVTAQMHRLEEAVGQPLLAPRGRGRGLTEAGEMLALHARRILDAHRDALLSIRGSNADGRLSIGATQDFAGNVLPQVLRTFAQTHPRLRIELRIGRSGELSEALDEGLMDVVIVMRSGGATGEVGVLREPMVWVGARSGLATSQSQLPLALLDPPCGFRSAALAALDAAGQTYRMGASSATLSGLHAAVSAGIAITLRTGRFIDSGLTDVGAAMGLPDVPDAEFAIRVRRDAPQPALALVQSACDALHIAPIAG
jgi:DNA-binding transcriptional LysR family regulator